MPHELSRRSLTLGLTSLALAPLAMADEQITMTTIGPVTRAFVEKPKLIVQQCPQWCWAASIAMIFSSHDKIVSQGRIVEETFKKKVCEPAKKAKTIADALTRDWETDDGEKFRSDVIAQYDLSDGKHDLPNTFVRDELKANRPLLYGNTHHAMVNYAFDFRLEAWGLVPIAAWVADPLPYKGFRLLNPAEFKGGHLPGGEMTFLAAVHIS